MDLVAIAPNLEARSNGAADSSAAAQREIRDGHGQSLATEAPSPATGQTELAARSVAVQELEEDLGEDAALDHPAGTTPMPRITGQLDLIVFFMEMNHSRETGVPSRIFSFGQRTDGAHFVANESIKSQANSIMTIAESIEKDRSEDVELEVDEARYVIDELEECVGFRRYGHNVLPILHALIVYIQQIYGGGIAVSPMGNSVINRLNGETSEKSITAVIEELRMYVADANGKGMALKRKTAVESPGAQRSSWA
jgi:hypothetical protein